MEDQSKTAHSAVQPALIEGGVKLALVLAVMLFHFRLSAADRPAAIPQKGLNEIGALLEEKASWTPAQTKMESQLIHAVKRARGQPFAPKAKSVKLNLALEPDGRVLADITARVNPELLAFIQRGGGRVINSFPRFRAIRALLTIGQLETLAASRDVISIRRADQYRLNTGSVTSQGDVTHRAAAARAAFGVNGAGIKVGVLSDSVDYLADAQASGDLGTVTILPGQDGIDPLVSTGEGTAMLEIVHDLAPGAQLYFASATGSQARFAQNILDLRTAGCDIIVDDFEYHGESPFQDGLIAQAVNTITASGALYFSAAANSGNKDAGTSGTWEGDFVDGGAVSDPITEGGRVHSFGAVTYDTVTAGGGGRYVELFWSDPLGASTNDYDVFVLDRTGANVVLSSTTRQTGTQDPYEFIDSIEQDERIVIVKYSGAPRFLHLDTGHGRLSISTSGATTGHSAAVNAFSVAAVDITNAYPSAFTGGSAVSVEDFSSDGPRHVFYNADGTPITPGDFTSTGGTVRQKPEIAAADGVATSLPGFAPFHGTSAAAPHAAAIAALLLSYRPTFSPALVRSALVNSALDIGPVGNDRDSGAGIVMADLALLWQPLTLTIPSLAMEGDGVLAGKGNIAIIVPLGTNLTVALASSDTNEVLVPTNVVILAGHTNSTFDLTIGDDGILDGTQTAIVTASSPGYGAGTAGIQITDRQVAVMGLSIPPEATEGDPPVMGVLFISSPVDKDVRVELSSSDTNVIQVPPFVLVPANEDSASFHISIVDDTIINGSRTAIVRAHVDNWLDGGSFITVRDNESTNLLVTAPTQLSEAGGVLTNAGSVQIGGTLLTNLSVSLSSSDPARLSVPASVTIPAGQTNVLFDIAPIDNNLVDGAEVVTLAASAPKFGAGSATTTVYDDESPPLPSNPYPPNLASNIPATARLTWQSLGFNSPVTFDVYFGASTNPGPGDLQGSTTNTNWLLPPLAPLTTYYWKIRSRSAGTTDGPIWRFTTRGVDHFTWNPISSPKLINQPFTATILARDENQTTVSNFMATVALNAIQAGSSVPVSMSPPISGVFSNGAWVGDITIQETGTVVLNADDGAGHLGPSSAFAVLLTNDLALTALASPNPVAVGANLTYTLTIMNAGPAIATGIGLADSSPFNADLVQVVPSQGACSNSAGMILCNLGSLSAGAAATVTIVVKPSAVGFVTNLAVVSSDSSDPYPPNNSVLTVTPVTPPSLDIGDVAVSEGNVGLVPAVFPVVLSGDHPRPITVAYATQDGTAQAGTDYYPTNGVLAFSPTVSTQFITVWVQGDTVVESNETLFVSLSNPINALLGKNQGQGTILNDDGLAGVVDHFAWGAVPSPEGINVPFGVTIAALDVFNAVVTNFNGTVALSEASQATPISPAYSGAFSNGLWAGAVTVFSPNPSLLLRASDGAGHEGTSNPFEARLHDDIAVTVSSAPDPVAPGENLVYVIVVTNIGPSSATGVTVTNILPPGAAFVSASASLGSCSNSAGTVICNLGTLASNSSASLTIVATSPSTPGNITNQVTVSRAEQDAFADNNFAITITTVRPVTLSISDASALEGNAGTNGLVFNLQLAPPTSKTVTVSFATQDGTAATGSDYLGTNGVLIFLPGKTNQTITVPVLGDIVYEADETFFVTLSNPTNAAIGRSQGTGTILNDDPFPILSISDISVPEGNSGTTNAVFTVMAYPPSSQNISFVLYTRDGTAIAPRDYIAFGPSFASLPPGSTNVSVTVAIKGDTINEPDENFFLYIAILHGAAITNDHAACTIINDDFIPIIAGAGFQLLAETCSDGAIDPGETVTVRFGLSNVSLGNAVATNLSATLLATNGIIAPSGPQSYGMLTKAGPAVFRPFTFTPSGSCGDSITAILHLQDGSNDLGVATFSLGLGRPKIVFSESFDAVSAPSLPPGWTTLQSGTGAVWSTVTDTSDTLPNSVFAPDLPGSGDTQLTSPTIPISTAAAQLSFRHSLNLESCCAHAWLEISTNGGPFGEFLAAGGGFVTNGYADGGWSGPSGGFTTTVANLPPSFAGRSAQLRWRLGTAGGAGAQGWYVDSVAVSDGFDCCVPNDLSVSISGAPNPVRLGGNLTYSITVVNNGPAAANGVSVTNFLPAGATLLSVTPSQGSCNNFAGGIRCALNNLAGGASASITLVVSPNSVGSLTNVVTVGRAEADPVPANNSAILVTTVTPPALAISDVLVTERNSGITNVAFSVQLSAPSTSTVQVAYATADETATAGSDYLSTNGTLVFLPGQTNKAIVVSVLGDITWEPDETFLVKLSSPSNAVLVRSQAEATILNNEPTPALSISDASLVEGDTGRRLAIFNVSLFPPSSLPVWFYYATMDGTATAPGDYDATVGALVNFSPGQTNAAIFVTVVSDLLVEPDETFFVNLYGASNANILKGQGKGTILNDDGLPGRLDHFSWGGIAATQFVNSPFAVTLAAKDILNATVANYNGSVSLSAITADGLTNIPITPALTGTFASGVWTGNLAVLAPAANAYLLATDSAGRQASSANFSVILRDDIGVMVQDTPNPVAAGEKVSYSIIITNIGPSDASNVTFTNFLPDAASFSAVTTSQGACALAPGVITCSLGTLGANSNATIRLVVASPPVPASLTNRVVISRNGLDAFLGNNAATNVTSVQLPTLSINDASVAEGDSGTNIATFVVQLSPPVGARVAVHFATADASANSGTDYLATAGTLIFAPGETNHLIDVPILGDIVWEPDETFLLNLSSPASAVLGRSQGVGTILNDDALPALSISDAIVTEGNAGVTNAVFAVNLWPPSSQPVSVQYYTTDDGATAPADYVPVALGSALVTFSPGQTNATLAVAVKGDTIIEPDEAFLVYLSGPSSNSVIAGGPGVGLILNDDGLPGHVDHFLWNPVPSPRIINVPFAITLTALDAFNATVQTFTQAVTLAAFTSGGLPVALMPTNSGAFTNGIWSGNIAIQTAASNLVLSADDGDGHGGLANAISVIHIDSDTNGLPDDWELAYFGHIGVDPNDDPDHDHMSNLEEYIAGTDPTNRLSVLRLQILDGGGGASLLHFLPVPSVSYTLQYRTNLTPGPWTKLLDVPAQAGTNPLQFLDPNAGASTRRFYRIATPQQ